MDARAEWDALVLAGLDSAEAVEELRADLVARGVAVDGEPLCRVVRPHFVTRSKLAEVERVAAVLARAITKVAAAERERHRNDLQGWMADLLDAEGDVPGHASMMRFDAFLARTRLHYVECNADSPAGAGHLLALEEFFAALPGFDAFAARSGARPQRPCDGVLDACLTAWRQAGGEGAPTIAIVQSSADVAHRADAEITAAHHRDAGVETIVADPSELVFANGVLCAGGTAIDVVHRELPTGRCLALLGSLGPLLDALRARAVVMVNPFHAELLGHKALFALLTDPSTHALLDPDERAVVREHVPWARVLSDDLVPEVLARRERLVLKPAHGFGGQGVVLGWRVDDDAWRAAVQDGVAQRFVVQERVEEHRVAYPALEPGLPERALFEDTDPFLFDGRLTALLTRLSGDEITNVRLHAAGGVVPTFVLDG